MGSELRRALPHAKNGATAIEGNIPERHRVKKKGTDV